MSDVKRAQKEINRNPTGVCTWDDGSGCSSCSIHGKLACKWDKGGLKCFYGISIPTMLISLFTMVLVGILTGHWWMLITYVVYFFVMFNVFEIRFLCSHCPYYAEEGRILHCLANHGCLKIWKYNPAPLNRLEKFMMYFLLATVFFIFPLGIAGYGIVYISLDYGSYGLPALLGLCGLWGAILVSAISFVYSLKKFFCAKCLNFSCPLNSVSKPVIDAFLKKNEVMRNAWESAGWKMTE
jgi:hypothetical protein